MNSFTELAKLASLPKELIEKAERLCTKLAGKAATETGELFADQIRYWRFKNQVSILGKAEAILTQSGLQARAVNLKLLVPLIEHASLEENEDAQLLWAHLLVNATQDQANVVLHRTCVDLLKTLSGIEAELLKTMFLAWKAEEDMAFAFAIANELKPPSVPDNAVAFPQGQLLSQMSIPESEGQVIFDNLLRMNLVRYPDPDTITVFGGSMGMKPSKIHLTYLGIRLLTICTKIGKASL